MIDEFYTKDLNLRFSAFDLKFTLRESESPYTDDKVAGYRFKSAWVPMWGNGDRIDVGLASYGQWMTATKDTPNEQIAKTLSIAVRETLKSLSAKLKDWFCDGAPHKAEVELKKFRHKRRVYYRIRGEFSALRDVSAEKTFDRKMRECEYDSHTGRYELV